MAADPKRARQSKLQSLPRHSLNWDGCSMQRPTGAVYPTACQWQWLSEPLNDGTTNYCNWVPYDNEQNIVLEESFQTNDTTCEINVDGRGYKISFQDMQQSSVADPRRVRQVRRVRSTTPNALVTVLNSMPTNPRVSATDSKDDPCPVLLHPPSNACDAEECAVCLEEHDEHGATACRIKCQCRSFIHESCMRTMLSHSSTVSCPGCNKTLSGMHGPQPDGFVSVKWFPTGLLPLDGCRGLATIKIEYFFHEFKTADGHKVPSVSRIGLIPDTTEGRLLCEAMVSAFLNRWTFRVGTSMTTRQDNQIVWNDIPHKTATSGGPKLHGFPDELYIERAANAIAQVRRL